MEAFWSPEAVAHAEAYHKFVEASAKDGYVPEGYSVWSWGEMPEKAKYMLFEASERYLRAGGK